MYRPEAVEARKKDGLGKIILIRPVSFSVMTAIALSILGIFIVFLFAVDYSKKNTVSGEITPDKGTIKVSAPNQGLIYKKLFVDNVEVKAGDVLFVLRNALYMTDSEDAKNVSIQEIKETISSINLEISDVAESNEKNIEVLKLKISNLEKEILYVDQQIVTQSSRLALSKKVMDKYKLLLPNGLVTDDQYTQKKIDFLNQTESEKVLLQKLSSLRNQKIDLGLRINESRDNAKITISRLQRELSGKNNELTKASSDREFAITSPIDGVVSSTLVTEGQPVDSGQTLASIIPSHSTLTARLLVPSKSIGFIEKGNPVSLRYQAFPYQQFGQHKGYVQAISMVPVMIRDTKFNSSKASQNEEALYIVDVALENQFILARGEKMPLMAGMVVEADIKYAKLPLYMWMFEPLLSLSKI